MCLFWCKAAPFCNFYCSEWISWLRNRTQGQLCLRLLAFAVWQLHSLQFNFVTSVMNIRYLALQAFERWRGNDNSAHQQ